MKLGFKRGQKGFTLVELMVVIAILAVLMAVVAPAVTGTKEMSVDGQAKGDGKATQTAADNFNNKSIKPAFPDVAPSNNATIYYDLWSVAGNGDNVTLIRKDGSTVQLSTKILPSGATDAADNYVYVHRILNFDATTQVYDADGSVKTATFVPDFLMKEPATLPLKGDESASLGSALNVYEEYLWLLLVNAPGSSQESRNVEIYRMTKFTNGTPKAFEYTQLF